MDGWVKLHRKLSDNPIWFCEKFTRGQAWVDLILLANHQDSYFYKRGVKVDVKRGQVGRSEVELSDRWKWSRSKVRKFLKDLEKEQQIIQHKTNVTQLISIINYNDYQQKEQQTIQQKNTRKTPKEHQKDTYKNVKKEKNDNKIEFNFSNLKKETWLIWTEHKKTQFKFSYKSEKSEQIAINELIKLSNNNDTLANKIINHSISQGYKGLFELKTNGQVNKFEQKPPELKLL